MTLMNKLILSISISFWSLNLFSQQFFTREIEISENGKTKIRQFGIKFYFDPALRNCRKELKHNQTILSNINKFGNDWRDSVVLYVSEDSIEVRKALSLTKQLGSIHKIDNDKKRYCDLYFDNEGYVIKKESRIRSNKKWIVMKEWSFDKTGQISEIVIRKINK
jgi:hypothetical protein